RPAAFAERRRGQGGEPLADAADGSEVLGAAPPLARGGGDVAEVPQHEALGLRLLLQSREAERGGRHAHPALVGAEVHRDPDQVHRLRVSLRTGHGRVRAPRGTAALAPWSPIIKEYDGPKSPAGCSEVL